MATSLPALQDMLEANGVKYFNGNVPGELIMTWETNRYLNPETNQKSAVIVIRLEDDGQFVKFFCPSCFKSDVPHKQALFEALLGVCWRTKMLQFEFDDNDGEIRAMIEWPVMDANLTWNQVSFATIAIIRLLDNYYDIIIKAGQTGILSWSDESDAEKQAEIQSVVEKLRRLLGDS